MVIDEIIARHLGDGGFGAVARGWEAVGVAFAEQKFREHARGHRLRHGFLARDGRQAILLPAREIALREGWMQDHVGIDVERLRHGGFEGVEVDEIAVEVDEGVEFGT